MNFYGWLKQEIDERDFKYKVAAPIDMDAHYDLTSGMPEIWDQGDTNSCTGHGIAAALAYAATRQGEAFTTPSRMFLYYQGRKIEGTTNVDHGAQIRNVIKGAVIYGAPPESEWDFQTLHLTEDAPTSVYTDAAKHRVVQYQSVACAKMDLLTALSEGYPIVFGFLVTSYFETPEMAKLGFLPSPGDSFQWVGGHCVVICGYNPDKKAFWVRNSWGPTWGIGGYFWMNEDYVLNPKWCHDFWIIQTDI